LETLINAEEGEATASVTWEVQLFAKIYRCLGQTLFSWKKSWGPED